MPIEVKAVVARSGFVAHGVLMSKAAIESLVASTNDATRAVRIGVEHDPSCMPRGKVRQAVLDTDGDEYVAVLAGQINDEPQFLSHEPTQTDVVLLEFPGDSRPFARFGKPADTDEISVGLDPANISFDARDELERELNSLSGVRSETELKHRHSLEPQALIDLVVNNPIETFALLSSTWLLHRIQKFTTAVVDEMLRRQVGPTCDALSRKINAIVEAFRRHRRGLGSILVQIALPLDEVELILLLRLDDGDGSIRLDPVAIAAGLEKWEAVLSDAGCDPDSIVMEHGDDGAWAVLYVLTSDGRVIGSRECFARTIAMFEEVRRAGESRTDGDAEVDG